MHRQLENANSVLWLVPERFGDALIGTAALALLKQRKPALEVTLVAFSPVSYAVYAHNPLINQRFLSPSRSVCKKLSNDHDVLLHSHPDVDTTITERFSLPYLAPKQLREGDHQGKVQLDFIADLFGMPSSPDLDYTLNYSDEDKQAVDAELERQNVKPDDILIGCSIGCNRMAKRGWKIWKPLTHKKVWPINRLHELDQLLQKKERSMRLVLIGAGSEEVLARHFVRKSPHTVNMCGNTSITEVAALLDRVDLVISSDTGLLHAACARRKPLIALHGPTDPNRSGPFPVHNNYCIIKKNRMSDISAEEVAAHVSAALGEL